MRLLRWIMLGYWALLSVLLLVPDPWALLGFARPLGPSSGYGTHLMAFLILGILVGWCRFPSSSTARAALLLGYAVVVELAQGLVPQRTVQLEDLAENLAGLALGVAICWGARRIRARGQ